MKHSKKWDLNNRDYSMQLRSALQWLAPLFILYIVQLLTTIAKKKVLGITDLTPDSMTIGAGQLYLLNQLYGLFNKLKAGK